MQDELNGTRSHLQRFLWVYVGVCLSILVYATYFWIKSNGLLHEPLLEKYAKLGDSFGRINALFSGFALIGVVISVVLQSKELSLQRQELAKQREEMEGQKEQLRLQNRAMDRQSFETSFFHLLELYANQRSMCKYTRTFVPPGHSRPQSEHFMGIQGVEEAGLTLFNHLSAILAGRSSGEFSEKFAKALQSSQAENADLSQLRRTIHGICSFIKSQQIHLKDDLEFYVDVFRGSVTYGEVLYCLITGLKAPGDKLTQYMGELGFFQSLTLPARTTGEILEVIQERIAPFIPLSDNK